MHKSFAICGALALLVAMAAAQAQSRYVCSNGRGGATVSDRPCNSGGMVYYGPTEGPGIAPRYEAPIPKVGEAPAHLKYMSARCSSLHDAIRTAQVRGLKSETVAEMQKNYRRECAENESEASARLGQDRRDQLQQRGEARQAEKLERDRASLREQQCGESKRILVTKRARTDLTEGERNELKRFEDNYHARCG
ncbi:hypothetical protein [Variovorax terrae]|uniref:DUF4124 domain-containing protein n=1 Tax=Variovorax terrae TaxID=2923278 RepID=A0A9X2AP84_9BURK|nr:hypothetical protein [Variovorax terrae]MCJ0761781.1 hypothetical protein [Variovorax terrae]